MGPSLIFENIEINAPINSPACVEAWGRASAPSEQLFPLPDHHLEHHREHHDLHPHHPRCTWWRCHFAQTVHSGASQPSAMIWDWTFSTSYATKQRILHFSLLSAARAHYKRHEPYGSGPWCTMTSSNGIILRLVRPSLMMRKVAPISSCTLFLVFPSLLSSDVSAALRTALPQYELAANC